MHIKAAGKSHIGKVRDANQDAFFVSLQGPLPLNNLFVVADGLGGHSAGDVASKRALGAFCDFINKTNENIVKNSEGTVCAFEDIMAEALVFANLEVHEQSVSNENYKGMGTTFSAAVINKENNCLHYVHVGDSRIYLVDDEGIKQVTADHSNVTADMVEKGFISVVEAKKYPRVVLSRAIGTDEEVTIDKGTADIKEGVKYILLCSDGLTNMLDDEQIFEVFKTKEDVDGLCERLVQGALNAGGLDNISVIVIGWGCE